ncbi:MAG: DMT family transporter [Bacteroidales bacterium]|nr:DMT family transporter [Bacteroidales bacterium]MDT8431259.1 DMT family transporter [Bacteroidales bacterium]
MNPEKLKNTLLAIAACLLWSSAFVGIKIGLPYTTPLQFAGTRFFISGLLVLPVAIYYNPRFVQIFMTNYRFILFLGLLQTFLQYALFYTGIDKVPGSVGAIVIGSGPLFIAIVAHFFVPGDTMNLKKAGIILFGFSGIILVSLGRNEGIDNAVRLAGILILVGNNIISGFSNVIIALEKKKIPPLVLSSISMIFGGLLLFLFSIPVEGLDLSPKPLPYYLSLGWLSILSALAISIWVILLKKPDVKVSDLNMWKFLIPVSGAILAWTILPGESPDLLSVLGMVITAITLIIISRNQLIAGANGYGKRAK